MESPYVFDKNPGPVFSYLVILIGEEGSWYLTSFENKDNILEGKKSDTFIVCRFSCTQN